VSLIPPTEKFGETGKGVLRARRCARHSGREAVGCCLQCNGFFCRECLVEHSGRLVCATCLASLAAAGRKETKRVRNWSRFYDVVGLGVAILVAIACFHLLGTLLLKIPTEVHEGTLWRHLSEGKSP
jgi:hypothetical protein